MVRYDWWLKTDGPILLCRRPERHEGLFNLIHIALASDVRDAKHQLCKYAANRPYIDS